MKRITIYTISDQKTGLVCYVGATAQHIEARFLNHKSVCKLSVFQNDEADPIIEPLEVVYSTEDACASERYWTEQMRAWGFNLENGKHYMPYKQKRAWRTYKTARINGLVRFETLKIIEKAAHERTRPTVEFAYEIAGIALKIVKILGGSGPDMKPITPKKLAKLEELLMNQKYL